MNDWKKEFDKWFNHGTVKEPRFAYASGVYPEVKAFIQSLLNKQREELREWAEGMKVEVGESVLPTLPLSTLNEAHNQVLDDLLTKLEKE